MEVKLASMVTDWQLMIQNLPHPPLETQADTGSASHVQDVQPRRPLPPGRHQLCLDPGLDLSAAHRPPPLRLRRNVSLAILSWSPNLRMLGFSHAAEQMRDKQRRPGVQSQLSPWLELTYLLKQLQTVEPTSSSNGEYLIWAECMLMSRIVCWRAVRIGFGKGWKGAEGDIDTSRPVAKGAET